MDLKITTPPSDIKELNEKIVDDLVRDYDDKNDLIKVLEQLKKENEYVIKEFTDLFIMLTEQMTQITNNEMARSYKPVIVNNLRKYGKYYIDAYIEKAYLQTKGLYRKNFVEQNEDFFLKNTFSDISNGKDSLIDKLFEFKDFWKTLKEENKKIIKFYLTTMCCYADVRYVNWNKYLVIKDMNKQYKEIYEKYDKLI
jgi:hypothetical protein